MTHLRIELNGITEEVSSSVISKLYEIVHEGVDASSNLQGRLHCPISYRAYITYLTTLYPDLYITTDDYAIPFEDSNMVTHLNSLGVGSNGMITENQAAAATSVSNSVNTTVTKFNELRYFTNVTLSKGGFTGALNGNCSFKGWTALEEVDISNFISLGHNSSGGLLDTFCNCTSLKTVTASDNLTKIGYNAFSGCTNLEDVTGLSGSIGLGSYAFENCLKLKNSSLANTNIYFVLSNNGLELQGIAAFRNCKALTTITFDDISAVPANLCNGCTNLTTVYGLASSINVWQGAFQNCSALTSIGNTTIVGAGEGAFSGCSSLDNINIAFSQNSGSLSLFSNCTSLEHLNCDWTNVTLINGFMFMNCTSLKTIDLTGITTINGSAFNGCINLETITGLSGEITIGGGGAFTGCLKLEDSSFLNAAIKFTSMSHNTVFRDCKALTEITLSSNNTMLPVNTFYDAPNIATINGTQYILKLGENVFKNLSHLTSLNLTGLDFTDSTTVNTFSENKTTGLFEGCSSLTTIGRDTIPTITNLRGYTFAYCAALTGKLNFPDLTSMTDSSYGNQFINCASLTEISLGHITLWGALTNQDNKRGMATGCTNLKILDLGDSVNTIYTYNCNGCSNLKAVLINNSTVPTISGNNSDLSDVLWRLFENSNVNVYVPDAAVNNYKAASKWSNFASNILPMSLYNESAILAS